MLLLIMSRPVLLVFLLLVLIITSQFEWRQQLVNDMDAAPNHNHPLLSKTKREDFVKEKVILSQEKKIYRLNELVRSLEQQLVQCKCKNETENRRPNVVPLRGGGMGLEQQHIVEN